jgi:hypothetical protein
MPYIKPEQRDRLDPYINALIEAINKESSDLVVPVNHLSHAGILNYVCTRLALEVIPVRQYWAIALKSGVFRNIADEFYRRYAVPYEEEKISSNGDVLGYSQ